MRINFLTQHQLVACLYMIWAKLAGVGGLDAKSSVTFLYYNCRTREGEKI